MITNGAPSPADLTAPWMFNLQMMAQADCSSSKNRATSASYENGQLLDAPLLDITDRVNDSSNEMGLLGLAFHPDYEQNGFFFVNYTGDGGNTRISRFQASGNSADPNSETVLLVIEQPYPNHNGGALPLVLMAISMQVLETAVWQVTRKRMVKTLTSLLGKILRIDVNNGDPVCHSI